MAEEATMLARWGRVMVRKTLHLLAPSVNAAWAGWGSCRLHAVETRFMTKGKL